VVVREPQADTKLHQARLARGVTQEELAWFTGISRRTLQRIERGDMSNPPIRYLTNCALVLGLELDDLIEDEWRQWLTVDVSRAPAPPAKGWWEDKVPAWLRGR
jgi:transcriptional regulator with XRE-family HTH domain